MNKTSKTVLKNVPIFLPIFGFAFYVIGSINNKERNYVNIRSQKTDAYPYRQVLTIELSEKINRFDLHDDKLYVSTDQTIFVFDTAGNILNSFASKPDATDIAVDDDNIFLLYPARIEIYSLSGESIRTFEACSDLSDYYSFALSEKHIFVTDSENKNICKYTREGDFVKFIASPHGFVIPGYCFDIEVRNDTLFCVNPGRHQIETYTLDGDFIAAFGQPGEEPGSFCGCCNPVYVSFTPSGELITSEKGVPRISCFDRNGKFRSVLLDGESLGGGNSAYEVKISGDKLFVADKNRISIYEYDTTSASGTACSACSADCPLRKRITL